MYIDQQHYFNPENSSQVKLINKDYKSFVLTLILLSVLIICSKNNNKPIMYSVIRFNLKI